MPIRIGEFTATELTEKHGTPLYVYEKQRIQKRYTEVEEALQNHFDSFRINYAVKSNFNPAIVETLVEQGASLDCASKAEVLLASKTDTDEIMYTAPYNRSDEIQFALEHGATVNLNSIYLLDKIDEPPEQICFRIDPGVSGGDFGVIGDGETKFGVPREKAVEAYRKAKEMGVKKFGIHMMTGSNVKDPEYFKSVTEQLVEIMVEVSDKLGIEFEFMDIGGGLGIPYEPGEEDLDVEQMARGVSEALQKGKEQSSIGNPELVIEPGRYLVAQSGHLISKVTGTKTKGESKFVGLDTGMHQNLRPSLLDAYHEIKAAVSQTETEEVTVVGPVCSSVDKIAEERVLPKMQQGDIVSIEDVGAYGFVMASHWNSRPLPKEIMVDENSFEVVRQRENLEDIFHGTKYGPQ